MQKSLLQDALENNYEKSQGMPSETNYFLNTFLAVWMSFSTLERIVGLPTVLKMGVVSVKILRRFDEKGEFFEGEKEKHEAEEKAIKSEDEKEILVRRYTCALLHVATGVGVIDQSTGFKLVATAKMISDDYRKPFLREELSS